VSAAAAAASAFFTSANSFAAAANSASALSAFASATFAASSASAIAMSAATGSAWGAAMCSSMCSSTLLEEHTENAYTCTRSVLPVNWKNTLARGKCAFATWQRLTQSHTVLWAAWEVWRLAAVHLVWRLVWHLAADRQANGHLHNRRPALSAQTLARAPAVLAEVGHCKRELHQCWPAHRQD
jgi:hypothetical protein